MRKGTGKHQQKKRTKHSSNYDITSEASSTFNLWQDKAILTCSQNYQKNSSRKEQ